MQLTHIPAKLEKMSVNQNYLNIDMKEWYADENALGRWGGIGTYVMRM